MWFFKPLQEVSEGQGKEFKRSLRGSLEGFSKCLKTPQSCLRVAYMLPRRKVSKEFQDVHVV